MSLSDELKKRAENLTVLYVEDDEDTRNQISQILQLFFKEVVVAKNGLEALIFYKQKVIDLVVTDLTMPKMNGLDMIKEIKKINHNQHIVVLTARYSSEDLMEAMYLQLDGFLLKPIKMDKFMDLLLKITYIINLEEREVDEDFKL